MSLADRVTPTFVKDRVIFEVKVTAQGYDRLTVPVTLTEKGKDKVLECLPSFLVKLAFNRFEQRPLVVSRVERDVGLCHLPRLVASTIDANLETE